MHHCSPSEPEGSNWSLLTSSEEFDRERERQRESLPDKGRIKEGSKEGRKDGRNGPIADRPSVWIGRMYHYNLRLPVGWTFGQLIGLHLSIGNANKYRSRDLKGESGEWHRK